MQNAITWTCEFHMKTEHQMMSTIILEWRRLSSENRWARRAIKRSTIIQLTRQLPEHMFLEDLSSAEASATLIPPSAMDPSDDTLSKRSWERHMMAWRHQLKDAAHKFGYYEPGAILLASSRTSKTSPQPIFVYFIRRFEKT